MAKCPHCDKGFTLSPHVLDKETLSLHMTWEGEMIEARTIGGMIENTRKLLAEVAKQSGMKKPYIAMAGIDFGEREATFHFTLLEEREARKARESLTRTTDRGGGDGD